jgi:hypothetical protein
VIRTRSRARTYVPHGPLRASILSCETRYAQGVEDPGLFVPCIVFCPLLSHDHSRQKLTGAWVQVRRLCELGEAGAEARLVLLDIPDDGAYYLPEPGSSVDAPGVRAFLAAYAAKGLTRHQLKK